MVAERRFAYRVSLEADEAIRARISGDACQSVGEITDLSLTGATVRIGLEEDAHFAVSENVTVSLDPKRMRSVQVLAIVRSRTELDGFRNFGLAFPNPSILRARLSAGLLRLFNERHSFRVEPTEQDRVDVEISGKGYLATGHMRDVSADGLAVVIDLEAERILSNVVHVNVQFQLPGQDRPVAFQAEIRNRYELVGDETVCVGLRFDPEASSNFASQQRSVTDYVMVRQRELRESLVET